MLSTAVQVLAFVLALLGLVGVTVATVLPNWKVSMTGWTSLMTPISHMQGLWMDCNFYSSGVFSCTMKTSMLSLPPYLQVTRIAMVLSSLITGFGICLASLGLKCTQWGGSRRAKAHTAIAAGSCFVLSSILCLVPASWYTKEIITAFLTTDVPESSKYQPGGALCLTFVSAGFLLASGTLLSFVLKTIWMVLFLFGPQNTTSMSSKNNLKYRLIRPQDTVPVCVSPSQVSLGPEKLAVFLGIVHL
uniref:Claudin n=1 Tax=Periophthalmus magnuspinnatus TaxID=409849 RepID=A0A3B4BEH8_9GOBI